VQVLSLLQQLVDFVCCNDATFLHCIISGQCMERGLRERGAPEYLIATFMVSAFHCCVHHYMNARSVTLLPCMTAMYCLQEVIQRTGGMEGAIFSFGRSSGIPPALVAELISAMKQAERSLSPSRATRSTSPRSPNRLPYRTTQDMLDQVDQAASGTSGSFNWLASVQISTLANAVVVPVDDLSPAVIIGLECQDAVPFLILRWLSTCLVEVWSHSFQQSWSHLLGIALTM
jgi:hypothetical protein